MGLFDSHAHAWERWPYARDVPDPGSRGSGEALLWEMDTHGVEHAVVVGARIGDGAGGAGFGNPQNNAYVTELALRHPDRLTAWVDVDSVWTPEYHTRGAAQRLTAALADHGAGGFTHYFGADDDGWLRTDDARGFFRTAAEEGAVASLSIAPVWLGDLKAVLEENPQLRVLLHHLGLPRHDHLDGDVDAVAALARFPNVGIKLSGLHYIQEQKWRLPPVDGVRTAQRLLEAFGAQRLYWGSDFPASRDLITYTQSIEVVRSALRGVSQAELELILGDNLRRLLGRGP